VHHLAVNALLKSSQINELEGGALLGFNAESQDAVTLGSGQANWDESVSCAPAFRVLKQLVQGWLSDAVSSGNTFADALLQHLYRWLCRCAFSTPSTLKFGFLSLFELIRRSNRSCDISLPALVQPE